MPGPHHLLGPLAVLALLFSVSQASVFLITRDNVSFVFEDADAAFGGMIPPIGMQGVLKQAQPFDGCTAFDNVVEPGTPAPQFALIMRGNCQFDVKVLNAQLAGYSAAVIYNNEESNELITMSGRHLWDIYIPAVFVTLGSGKQMMSLTEQLETVCFLTPAFDNTAWSIMTASFLSLLALCSVLTLFMYIRRARLRELASLMLEREPLGMPANEVKALPEVTFREGAPETEGMETCAICLEDYEDEETLRVLPCKHGFHVACIDQWLTTRSPCCPVCKRDCKRRREGGSGEGSSSSGGGLEGGVSRAFSWRSLIPESYTRFSALFTNQESLQAPLLPITSAPEPLTPEHELEEEEEQPSESSASAESSHESGDDGSDSV